MSWVSSRAAALMPGKAARVADPTGPWRDACGWTPGPARRLLAALESPASSVASFGGGKAA
eukprot:14941438-Alexandrium_andersonii.AAC.1